MSLLTQKKKTGLTNAYRPETEKGKREACGPRSQDSSLTAPLATQTRHEGDSMCNCPMSVGGRIAGFSSLKPQYTADPF